MNVNQVTWNRSLSAGLSVAVMLAGGFSSELHADVVTVPYSEDFASSTSLDGYPDIAFTTTPSPTNDWSINAERAHLRLLTASQIGAASVQLSSPVTTPITVSTELRVPQLAGGSDVGLALFGSSPDFALNTAHYLLDIRPLAKTMRIVKMTSTGSAVEIVSATTIPGFNWDGPVYQLIAEATPSDSGLALKLTVFNVATPEQSTTVSGTDTSPLTGTYFGLRSRSGAGDGLIRVYYDDFSIVPEPASLGLLLAGGLVMGLRRRQGRHEA